MKDVLVRCVMQIARIHNFHDYLFCSRSVPKAKERSNRTKREKGQLINLCNFEAYFVLSLALSVTVVLVVLFTYMFIESAE